MELIHPLEPPCQFSLIIPVLDEMRRIGDCLSHLDRLEGDEPREIIVVDGDPQGRTIRSLRGTGILALASSPGRARQMNAGAAMARGEILIFLHVDTQLPANALQKIGAALRGTDYVGGAFDLEIGSGRPVYRLIARVASIRSRLTRVPYGDQAIFFRAAYFRALGGYQDTPFLEDLEIMRRVKKRGDAISILSDRVRTSPRRWEREGLVYGTLRNWLLVGLYHLGVPPRKLVQFYRSGSDYPCE